MRLHQLTMTAVGPFADSQVVDFQRLAESGVFLLEGPTGVGKSTVLDSITFALYGAVASDSADLARMHSHFAEPDVTPEVILDFSVNGQQHRVVRSPQHQRPKRRGDGFTTENAAVALFRVKDAGATELITDDHKEAGIRVQELVGLDRAQFSKVVLLPQGEFSRFLEADDDIRRKLLTSLFGAWQYDKITELLAEEAKQAKVRITEQKNSVGEARAAALEAAALSEEQVELIKEIDPAELTNELKSIGAVLAQEVTSAGSVSDNADRERQRAEKEATAAVQRKERIDSVLEFARRQREFAATAERRTRDQTQLAKARRAVGPGHTLTSLNGAIATQMAAETTAVELAGSRDELERWSANPDGLREHLTKVGDTAAKLGPAVTDEEALPAKKTKLAELQAEATDAHKQLQELNEQKKQLPELISDHEEQVNQHKERADRVKVLRESQVRLTSQLSAAKAAADLQPALVAAQDVQRAAIDDHQRARSHHQELVQRRIVGMAAELAGQLQSGEPCVVCGSTEHPQLAQPDDQAVSEGQIDSADAKAKQFERERDQADKNVADLNQKLAARRAAASDARWEAVQAELDKVIGQLQQAEAAAADLPRLRAKLAGLQEQREHNEQKILNITGHEKELTTRVDSRQQEITDLDKQLAELRENFATVAARRQNLESKRRQLDRLQEAISALNSAVTRVDEQRAQFEQDCKKAGFKSLSNLQDALLPEDDLRQLASVVEEDDVEKAGLAELAKGKELQGIDPDSVNADEVTATANAAEAALHKAQTAADEATRRLAKAEGRAERFGQAMSRVEESLAELDRVTALAEPIQELAGLAAGTRTSRQGRIALTSFVLQRYLQQVVIAANRRLTRIAGGKYELVQNDAVQRATDRTGLGLQVLDRHTNQERSPKTLSGGEKFYTSLALALGLADVVQAEAGGAAMDTLFIDEGFGTLDPDVLEDVIEVIDGLRENGRSVGIVSHVTELKERVSERIKIRRPQQDGPASIEVIA